ncbi:MAG: L,D-transpeptidase family protein [Lachnospiraceae bacterium]|nr:L,D-transpeptidase family protein [Lachnospiraceae bacterium]
MDSKKLTQTKRQKKRRQRRKIAKWRKYKRHLRAIMVILAFVYVLIGLFFEGHYFVHSSINGISASAETALNMQRKIIERLEEYELSIVAEGEKVERLDADELGINKDISLEYLESMLREQNGLLWGYYLIVGKQYMCDDFISCDMSKVQRKVDGLACVENKNPIKAKSATVKYSKGKFEAVEEVYGTEVDLEQLSQEICKKVRTLTTELDLRRDGCYRQPTYTSDCAEMKELLEVLNRYLDTEITYTIGHKREMISRDIIGSWLYGNDVCQPEFDEDAMITFVSEMSKKYDTFGRNKHIQTRYGVDVTVPGGNYGWLIDKDKEIAQLKKDIVTGDVITRDFTYRYSAASHGKNDYGRSYIEINKTAQRLFLIMDGEVVLETPVVTGKANPECDTPVGAYRITYCERNATLRGDDYVTPVSFWMPFCGNIGLHDATWQAAFGGTRYLDGYGSHGCVNLPLSAAETIYSYVSTGFPVLIYDLPGTETTDEHTQ